MRGGPLTNSPGTAFWRIALTLAAISFPLHFAWEWAQCRPYFVHGSVPSTASAMLMASGGDVILTELLYFALALARGPRWPLAAWSWRTWVAILMLSSLTAVGIELFALATGRWTYTPNAPRLPGTPLSLLPILQLILVVPGSLQLVRALAAARDIRRRRRNRRSG